MSKVHKNYNRKDFSDLLSELQSKTMQADPAIYEEVSQGQMAAGAEGIAPKNEELEVRAEEKERKSVQQVSIHRKRRQSQLDNVRMRYAFSTKERILHDRSCEYVWRIPDEEFQMAEDFTLDMPLCPDCQRMSVIRVGIGADGKRIKAYNWFFNKARASSKDLYDLIITHQAGLKWIAKETMQIKVHEDTWVLEIEDRSGKLRLLHNNYSVIDGQQRFFEDGFHVQNIGSRHDFEAVSKTMVNYTWNRHLEGKRREEERKQKELEREQLIHAALNDMLAINNYVALPRKSFHYVHMVYIDLRDYFGDKIFEELDIHPVFEKEYELPDYAVRIVYCKVLKRQKDVFLDAMKKLACNIIKAGHLHYIDICKKMKRYLDSEQEHGEIGTSIQGKKE